MAWQDPKDKDPWNRGGQKPQDDLDKMAKELQDKLKNFFGGGKGGDGKETTGGLPQFGLFILLLAVLWAATGFYKVTDGTEGVVKRFGEYTKSTQPGLRWHLPVPIETVTKVNTDEIRNVSFTKKMLTKDENIVDINLNVQYNISDSEEFLFNVRGQAETIEEVSRSAIREIVGKNILDYIILVGRTDIANLTRARIQETLDSYKSGIRVTAVNLVNANFPSEVNDAVQDAIRAREDKETAIFAAETYANDIVPKSRGEAGRRMEDANAYKAEQIADAEGEASRFDQLLVEYEKAPEVTRKRLYLETIEEVYAKTGKVIMDSKNSGNLIYLPVDQMLNKSKSTNNSSGNNTSVAPRNNQSVTGNSVNRERPSSRGSN